MRPDYEDTHFYLDNAPPEEVEAVLRVLSESEPLSNDALGERLHSDYGFRMQKDRSYSPRRLYDLGLAAAASTDGKRGYVMTDRGSRVRQILATDEDLYAELMHYLHYSRYFYGRAPRPYFWSYYQCSDILWAEKRILASREMASRVQSLMKECFPGLDYTARVGARFDGTAVGRCYSWLRSLEPSPIGAGDSLLRTRAVSRYEIAVLALDHVYRAREYRHGDPVVLDDQLLDEVARVFFLDHTSCLQGITLASRLTKAVRLADTYAGTSVTLMYPFGVENL